MKYDHNRHHRRSIRLKEYDYSQAGAYFVTICTQGRECLFWDTVDGKMRLNDAGRRVRNIWHKIPEHFPHTDIDEFIVMPNHFHGIIVIVGAPLVGALFLPDAYSSDTSGTTIDNAKNRAGTRPAPTLGDIAGVFKSITTHQYTNGVRQNNWLPFNGRLWQRNYYEHIIRNEEETDRICKYIINNPLKWEYNENNPANIDQKKGMACHAPTYVQCPNNL